MRRHIRIHVSESMRNNKNSYLRKGKVRRGIKRHKEYTFQEKMA